MPDVEGALAKCQTDLVIALEKIQAPELDLEKSQDKCTGLSQFLEKAQEKIVHLESLVKLEKEHRKDTYHELRNEQWAHQHAVKRKQVLSDRISELETAQYEKIKQMKELEKQNSLGSKGKIYNLNRKVRRAAETKNNAVQKAKAQVTKEKTTFYLLKKGVYSNETRNLVRILVQANVSNKHIMGVIEAVLAAAGITAVGRIHPRTVSHIIKEGYIAACIQLGYEMQAAEAMTFSADGTGHKNLNYNSRHANYKVKNTNGTETQVTGFLGIQRSLDGSRDWDDQLQNIFNIFNDSPLAKETNSFARLIETYTKLVGMHSDHCSNEKKDFELMKKKKINATHQLLGENCIAEESTDDLLPHFIDANTKMIEKAGGETAWNNLDETQQTEHKAEMLADLTVDLGKDSFAKLSDKEKSLFKLFVWDLNTVLGGYIVLSKFWDENHLVPPVLLPNKINAAIIQDKDKSTGDNVSDAARRAVKNSQCGAIKASKIAGDILNNKNDKTGHHDQFCIWWKEKLETNFTFPDTLNTRFQSHCEAAAVHMEENLVKALNDVPTRTELAVLALYTQAVSHPYMKAIREDPTTNALDLGPLNKKIEFFISRLIEDPTFLIGENVTHEVGTFNGTSWRSKEVIKTINTLAPEFPHLKPALVAFCGGAHEYWKRFTSEYSPGGLIDEATQEEKDLAWMPSTNNFRLTLLQYNARTMFAHNNTAAFMDEMFKLARETDTSEKDRKREIIKHTEEIIAGKMAAKKKSANLLAETKLQFDQKKIQDMKGAEFKVTKRSE
ncbi:hypothetical protein BDZ97DRAFT_1907224 [Flammula alnicola]|nr:hypothetical protein BDZ97DRAFT_1907224 [Flammula alnicola]